MDTVAINRRRLFVASCAPLAANGMAFAIGVDIMGDLGRVFVMSKAVVGILPFLGSIGGAAFQFAGGAVLDFVGVAGTLWLACACHITSLTLTVFAQGFWSLAVGGLFGAVAGNLIEASINPLVATMYPDRKTHALNVLHTWWPGGIVIGGLLAYAMTKLYGQFGESVWLAAHGWRVKMAVVYVPVLLYPILMLGQRFPKTERVQAGVPARDMFREALRPMYLVLVFCMLLTASIELGPNRWVGVFIKDMFNIEGVLLLVYMSILMFVLRFFAGPLARLITPIGILIGSSILSGVGLLWLSYAAGKASLVLSATVWGVGVAYIWPTMLGTVSERFPKGGAFLLGILGAAAGLFLACVTQPGMGWLHDRYTLRNLPPEIAQKVRLAGRWGLEGVDQERLDKLPDDQKAVARAAQRAAAAVTFRYVAIPTVPLLIIFSAIAFRDRAARRRGPRGPATLGAGGSGGT